MNEASISPEIGAVYDPVAVEVAGAARVPCGEQEAEIDAVHLSVATEVGGIGRGRGDDSNGAVVPTDREQRPEYGSCVIEVIWPAAL